MRIDFESSGGFANLHLVYHADTDTLSHEQSVELLRLVQNTDVFNVQQSDITPSPTGGPPDVFTYQLSISDGERRKDLSFNDVTIPAKLHPLLTELRRLALEQKLK
jgi:hypothetical protein